MDFQAWPKIPRLNREIVVSEKIDGTNAAIIFQTVGPSGEAGVLGEESPGAIGNMLTEAGYVAVGAQSRKRLIYPNAQRPNGDNAGFAEWVWNNAQTLYSLLGPGRHFGEWWGKGVQRGYGLETKAFSLFNTHRYKGIHDLVGNVPVMPVPVLYQGPFDEVQIALTLDGLRRYGSRAALWLTGEEDHKAEGIIIHHSASQSLFKVTLEGDEKPKGANS